MYFLSLRIKLDQNFKNTLISNVKLVG